MNDSNQMTRKMSASRIAVIIICSIVFVAGSYFFIDSIIWSVKYQSFSLNIYSLVCIISAVLLMITATVFHHKKTATVSVAVIFLLFSLNFLYNFVWNVFTIISYIDVLSHNPLTDYSFFIRDIIGWIRNLAFCVLFFILSVSALEWFKNKRLLVSVIVIDFAYSCIFGFISIAQSLSGIFEYNSIYSSFESVFSSHFEIIYSILSILIDLLPLAALLIYCLTEENPVVANVSEKRKANKRQKIIDRVIEQYESDIEEMNYRLSNGIITQEQYDENKVTLLEEANSALRKYSVYLSEDKVIHPLGDTP